MASSLTTLAVVLIVLLPGERLNQNKSGRITIAGSQARLINGESARMAIVKQARPAFYELLTPCFPASFRLPTSA